MRVIQKVDSIELPKMLDGVIYQNNKYNGNAGEFKYVIKDDDAMAVSNDMKVWLHVLKTY